MISPQSGVPPRAKEYGQHTCWKKHTQYERGRKGRFFRAERWAFLSPGQFPIKAIYCFFRWLGGRMTGLDAREIVALTKNEGRQGLERWFKNYFPLISADPVSAESYYWSVKNASSGAAYLLAFLYRANKLVLPMVESDLERARRDNPGLWVMDVAHILSPTILNRACDALDRGDVLCGLQRHYCAGAGPSAVVFNSSSALQKHLRSTRPGDEFMLVSIQQLAAHNALLEPTSASIKEWLRLNPVEEVLLLKTKQQPPTVEVIWDGRWDEDDVDALFQPSEGLFAVPYTWTQEFFIDAKMPNENGAIPLGGAY